MSLRLRWIKLWIDECLDGSIRTELSLEARGLWYELLLIAGKGVARDKRAGYLERKEGLPLTLAEIASRLNIPLDILDKWVPQFIEANMLGVDKLSTYFIVNWEFYQSHQNGHKKPNPDATKLRRRAKLHELANEFPLDVNKLATPIKINADGTIINSEDIQSIDQ